MLTCIAVCEKLAEPSERFPFDTEPCFMTRHPMGRVVHDVQTPLMPGHLHQVINHSIVDSRTLVE